MNAKTIVYIDASQVVHLPAHLRFPSTVKQVEVRAQGADRIVTPVGSTWSAFFLSGREASPDFMTERASQHQSDCEAAT